MRDVCVSCIQLTEAWQEVEVARSRSQQLQAQVENLQEEVSLQEARSCGEASLLTELESSLEVDLGVSKEQVSRTVADHYNGSSRCLMTNHTQLCTPQ